jgi:hypothetical protein
MASRAFDVQRDVGARIPQSVGMRIYWLVVTVLSLTLLGMTVHVAAPPDAAELVEVSGDAR